MRHILALTIALAAGCGPSPERECNDHILDPSAWDGNDKLFCWDDRAALVYEHDTWVCRCPIRGDVKTVDPAVEEPVEPAERPNPVSDAYEAGRESVALERELDDLRRIKRFIECLELEVGHGMLGGEVERHIKEDTSAARKCRQDTQP